MVKLERRDLIKGMGAVPLGLSLSETVKAQETSGGDEIWNFETGDVVGLSPTVVNGTVYFGSVDNNLYAVEASSGEEEWIFETGDRVVSSPTVVDGTVYVGSWDGNLYAVEASSGEEVWSFGTGEWVQSSPTVVDGTVYFGSTDENLYAVEASSGDEIWSYETGSSVDSSPTVVDGTVYVGSQDGNLYAVEAPSGEEVWSFQTGGAVRSSPTVVDGTVYVGSEDNSLYGVDASTGEEVWSFETGAGVWSSPTVVDGTVYVGSRDNNLYAVDATNGNVEWGFETGGEIFMSSPTVVDSTVYVSSTDNNLYAVNTSSGEEIWRFGTAGESSPTVVDGIVYIGSGDGNLYAVEGGISGSSEGSRVLFGTLGHHNSFAEQGPIMPSEYDGGSGGLGGSGGAESGVTGSDGSTATQDGTTGDGNQAGTKDSPLGGVATMFREPSENAGTWGAILGGGVLGAGYFAYRRRNSEEVAEETVYCTDCGNEINPSNTFCGNCGAQIDGGGKTDTVSETENQTPETERNVRVSGYSDLSVGEVVETGSGYQISEANATGTSESVWVVTPSTEGGQTLDVSRTQDFLNEIEPWTKMDSHPNLLHVYGHGTEPLPWFAVESAKYPSLREVTDDLSESQKIEVLSQICEAVHHVHRYGIVYENLSPESVRITDESQVKLRGALDHLGDGSDTEVTERDVVHRIGNMARYLLTSSERDGIQEEIDRSLSDNPSERYDTVLHFRDDLSEAYNRNHR